MYHQNKERIMKTSEQIEKIAQAFLTAQKSIKFAVKDVQNPHLKNRYADLPSVIDAVKTALNDAGISIIQTAGDLIDGKMILTTVLMHESGQWFRSDTTMPLTKQDAQGYGSAVTYARRYALSAITGLYQDDDDGNYASGTGVKQQKQAQQKQQPITQAKVTPYSFAEFEANKAKWKPLIESGKYTANQIIAGAESRGRTFSDDQKMELAEFEAIPANYTVDDETGEIVV
jgi:hypothetical protein